MSETLIKVENVSKKFCRDLKTGLWYGVKDLASEVVGRKGIREIVAEERILGRKGRELRSKAG